MDKLINEVLDECKIVRYRKTFIEVLEAYKQKLSADGNQLELLVILRPLINEYIAAKLRYEAQAVGKTTGEGYALNLINDIEITRQNLIDKVIELVGAV